jgi:hypothetical protein
MRNACTISVGKPERRGYIRDTGKYGRIILKYILKEIGNADVS